MNKSISNLFKWPFCSASIKHAEYFTITLASGWIDRFAERFLMSIKFYINEEIHLQIVQMAILFCFNKTCRIFYNNTCIWTECPFCRTIFNVLSIQIKKEYYPLKNMQMAIL